ncbi:hypothetical protein Hypma_007059 [Hypsizygus marmoreus]|uniref:F-box domain-containing protein n=1 Tax=Hypsizygus marmoreus TaxID=39966 RepID=A0A369KHH9_HYPMA|nr:hypothetical protein Hypma_007059 [Hypsizygus marmoreus]
MLEVPQDIIDTILDELDQDKSTLSACSLVSKSFGLPCQKHLYKKIQIILFQPPNKEHDRIEQLRDILKVNPFITAQVKHLVLRLPEARAGRLLLTLEMLPRVSILTVHPIHNFMLTSPWDSFSQELRRDILGFMRSPQVIDLSIHFFHEFPTNLLATCPQLKSISFYYISSPKAMHALDVTLPADEMTGRRGQLDCLRLYATDPIPILQYLSTPMASLDVSHLRKLTAKWYLNEIAQFQAVSEPFAKCLETLSLSILDPFIPWDAGNIFVVEHMAQKPTQMTHLRSLELKFGFHTGYSLKWLHEFLRTSLPAMNALTTISLEFYWSGAARNWEEIDQSLWEALQTPSVARSHIDLKWKNWRQEPMLETPPLDLQLMKKHLPRLVTRTGVSVTVKPRILFIIS